MRPYTLKRFPCHTGSSFLTNNLSQVSCARACLQGVALVCGRRFERTACLIRVSVTLSPSLSRCLRPRLRREQDTFKLGTTTTRCSLSFFKYRTHSTLEMNEWTSEPQAGVWGASATLYDIWTCDLTANETFWIFFRSRSRDARLLNGSLHDTLCAVLFLQSWSNVDTSSNLHSSGSKNSPHHR